MGGLPGIADAGGLPIGDGDGMNGIRVMIIENKNIMVASTGRNRKLAGLIRVGFEEIAVGQERGTDVVGTGLDGRSEIDVRSHGGNQCFGSCGWSEDWRTRS